MKNWTLPVNIVAAFALLTFATPSAAKASDTGKAICYEAEAAINSLVDYTNTSCIPVDDEKRHAVSLILISETSIFSVEAAKKAWLLTVAGFVGKAFNDRPKLLPGLLCVSDLTLTKQRKAFSLPIEVVKKLQRQVFTNKIGLDEMYRTITNSMKSDRCKG